MWCWVTEVLFSQSIFFLVIVGENFSWGKPLPLFLKVLMFVFVFSQPMLKIIYLHLACFWLCIQPFSWDRAERFVCSSWRVAAPAALNGQDFCSGQFTISDLCVRGSWRGRIILSCWQQRGQVLGCQAAPMGCDPVWEAGANFWACLLTQIPGVGNCGPSYIQ